MSIGLLCEHPWLGRSCVSWWAMVWPTQLDYAPLMACSYPMHVSLTWFPGELPQNCIHHSFCLGDLHKTTQWEKWVRKWSEILGRFFYSVCCTIRCSNKLLYKKSKSWLNVLPLRPRHVSPFMSFYSPSKLFYLLDFFTVYVKKWLIHFTGPSTSHYWI